MLLNIYSFSYVFKFNTLLSHFFHNLHKYTRVVCPPQNSWGNHSESVKRRLLKELITGTGLSICNGTISVTDNGFIILSFIGLSSDMQFLVTEKKTVKWFTFEFLFQ